MLESTFSLSVKFTRSSCQKRHRLYSSVPGIGNLSRDRRFCGRIRVAPARFFSNMDKNDTFSEHFQILENKGIHTLLMDNRLLHSTVEAFFPQNDEGFDMEPFTSAFGALLGKQLL